jgi:hypothetical protein
MVSVTDLETETRWGEFRERALAKLHVAHLTFDSAIGVGTTVAFVLPRERVLNRPDKRASALPPQITLIGDRDETAPRADTAKSGTRLVRTTSLVRPDDSTARYAEQLTIIKSFRTAHFT